MMRNWETKRECRIKQIEKLLDRVEELEQKEIELSEIDVEPGCETGILVSMIIKTIKEKNKLLSKIEKMDLLI